MANPSTRTWIIVAIAAAVLLLVGTVVVVCLGAGWFVYQRTASASPQTAPAQVTVEVTREVTLPAPTLPTPTLPAPTLPAPPTSVPPTATQPAASPAPNVAFQNVSFLLETSVARDATPRTVPAEPAVPDGAPWSVNPEYIEISLNGYVLPETFHKPAVLVYPAAEFAGMSEPAAEVIASTRQLLKDRPDHVEQIHTLPLWNAGQIFHARLHYLDFRGGSGVVFLTEYAQYFAPVNNHDMFYNFQGLTNDGRYYIVAILPASHPELIPNADISQDEFQKLADDYNGYLNTIIPLLESQPASSFHPSLADLDALLQSIEVK